MRASRALFPSLVRLGSGARSNEIAAHGPDWTGKMLLETSFLVDLLGGAPEARELALELDRLGETLRIPSPCAFELWVGASMALDPKEETLRLQRLLSAYESVPLDSEAARRAGELQGELGRQGAPLGTVDAEVAGIAIGRGEVLVTADRRLLSLGHGLGTRSYRRNGR